jgi:hypothetical protein
MTEPVAGFFELTGDDAEVIGDRRVVWHGCDFESVLRPRLEALIRLLAPGDDAQCCYIAYARDEAVFIVAWDVWLPPRDGDAQMETWYVRAKVKEREPPTVETIGKVVRARDYGDAVDRISAEFGELLELVLD